VRRRLGGGRSRDNQLITDPQRGASHVRESEATMRLPFGGIQGAVSGPNEQDNMGIGLPDLKGAPLFDVVSLESGE